MRKALAIALVLVASALLGGVTVKRGPENDNSGGFDVCRSGGIAGGKYDSATGLYGWTCGNYNWHGSVDSTQATASWEVQCTAAATPHATCLGTEKRLIGAVHRIGMAASRTRAGGTVYVPEGIYVDGGCGTLQGGGRAECPDPLDSEWKHLTHYTQSGPAWRGQHIQARRRVRIMGEGSPSAIKAPDTGIWQLFGTWLVNDRGPLSSAAAAILDGPSQDLPPQDFAFIVGGHAIQAAVPYCRNSSNASMDCDEKGDPAAGYRQWAMEPESLYGVVGNAIEADATAAAATLCVTGGLGTCTGGGPQTGLRCDAAGDCTGGGANTCTINQETTTATCAGDRRYRCWNTTGGATRDVGGCLFELGAAPDVDLGPCQPFDDAVAQDFITDAEPLLLVANISQCVDNAAADDLCGDLLGNETFPMEVRSTGAGCGLAGTTFNMGMAKFATNSPTWPFPFTRFRSDGSINNLYVVNQDTWDNTGGGFYNIGFMPGSWYLRDDDGDTVSEGADCLSGGAASGGDDEAACDAGSLVGFYTGAQGRVENGLFLHCSRPSGGPGCFDGAPDQFFVSSEGIVFREATRGMLSDFNRMSARDWLFVDNIGKATTDVGPGIQVFGSYTRYENIRFLNNRLSPPIQLGTQLVRGATFRDVHININVGAGNPAVNIFGGYDVTFDGLTVYGADAAGVLIQPRQLDTNVNSSIIKNLKIMNFSLSGYFKSSVLGDVGPHAGIWIDQNTDAGDVQKVEGLTIETGRVVSLGGDACGVWMEDEDDASGLLVESRPTWVFRNFEVISNSGSSSPVCAGDSDPGAVETAATNGFWNTSIHDTAPGNRYRPRMEALRRDGGINAPDWPVTSVSEADIPNASALLTGSTFWMHDGNGSCGHAAGNLTAGTSLQCCRADRAGSSWAVCQ